MAPHSSTLAWKIPWTEEPGGLQSVGSLRVRHDRATSLSLSCIGEGNGNPFQCSCLENPRNGGAWWAAVYGVTQSQTRLKRRSSSSSSMGVEGINWEVGIDISTQPYIKQVTNKNLPYSTGDSTQYSVMAYMGENLKKKVDICICVTDSPCHTPETNTTL